MIFAVFVAVSVSVVEALVVVVVGCLSRGLVARVCLSVFGCI